MNDSVHALSYGFPFLEHETSVPLSFNVLYIIDQLNSFAAEVTRVAKEVGTEGKLGGQAKVPGVSGTWKDLTDNMNFMDSNLTTQVRGIVKVVTAVADGDLNQKFVLEAKGEVAALAETINNMTDTLRTFADQVTTVAREVGIEGKLGGQEKVPGASGTWKDLTDNVNQLASNLTAQVRAIAEVSTAVTRGDLTRSITVEAEGEVAALKNNINQMIGNLKDTTQKNTEQDWLKTNLAKFSGMMQGQRSITAVAQLIMSELTPLVDASVGTFFMSDGDHQDPVLRDPEYNLVMANSGREALAHVLTHDFAVILMDVQMPEMDGFETTSIIKQRERSKNVPIIFLTANSQTEHYIWTGYSVGAVDFVFKPLDPHVLKSKVAVFVDLFKKNLLLQEQAEFLRDVERRERLRTLHELESEGRRRYQNLADAIPQIVFRADPCFG